MSSFERLIQKAARQRFIDRAVHLCGWCVLAALGIGFVLLLLDRIGISPIPVASYVVIVGLGMGSGIFLAYISLPEKLEIAVQLDRTLNLKDRLGTAIAINREHQTAHDDAFAELVRKDAEHIVQNIDVRRLTPAGFPRIWAFTFAAGILLGAGTVFLPDLSSYFRSARASSKNVIDPEVKETAASVSQAIDQTVENLSNDERLDDNLQEELNVLNRLSEQLSSESLSENEVREKRDESAARLQRVGEKLAHDAERKRESTEELARRFQGMDSLRDENAPMSARGFDEALKRGEFGEAARSLEELLERSQEFSEAERKQVADHLRDLSEELKQQPRQSDAEETRKQLEEALRESGLEEEAIQELLDPQNEQERSPDDLLRENEIDEDIARQLARDIEEYREQHEIEEQVEDDLNTASEELERAAEKIEQPPKQDHPNQRQDNDQSTQEESGSESQQNGSEQSEASEKTTRDLTQEEEAMQEPTPAPRQEQTQQQRQQDRATEESKEFQQAAESSDMQSEEQERTDESQPTESPMPEPSPDAVEAFRRFAERQRDSEKQQQTSEELFEAAKKLAENMTPKERQQWAERWQQELQDENEIPDFDELTDLHGEENETGSDPSSQSGRSQDQPMLPSQYQPDETRDVDLRGEELADEILAKWLDSRSDEALPPSDSAPSQQRVRQAQEFAERAVNESAVPRRYHKAIKQFFKRLDETIEEAAADSTGDETSNP